MNWMAAANAGVGVDAARLAADARAAQRGERAAQDRLYRILKLPGRTHLQMRRRHLHDERQPRTGCLPPTRLRVRGAVRTVAG